VALPLALVTVALAACTGLINNPPRIIGDIEIGAELPLSGDDAPDGLPVKAAVELAVRQAGPICGAASHPDICVRARVVSVDDVVKGIHDPAQGRQNVAGLVADNRVLGMVGPLYDSLARSELPVAETAGLAMVSPANTDECLTQEPVDGHCHELAARLRPHQRNTYFRVVTTQLVEGAAAADLAFGTLGKRRAFVLNDQTSFGQAIASEFAGRFHADGGTVVDAADLGAFDPAQTTSFHSMVGQANALGADVLYFAGSDFPAAASLRREMGTQMPAVPLLASDRLASNQFATSVGAHVRGTYYTTVGVEPARVKDANAFLDAYRKTTSHEATALSLQAFDATNVLIQAIARAIDDAGGKAPGRDQVLAEVARTSNFHGLMGVMSFDARGDTTLKVVTAYQWLAPTEPSGTFAAQITVR
jgi:branched-chain amino acid transport system substrate-binding protein